MACPAASLALALGELPSVQMGLPCLVLCCCSVLARQVLEGTDPAEFRAMLRDALPRAPKTQTVRKAAQGPKPWSPI